MSTDNGSAYGRRFRTPGRHRDLLRQRSVMLLRRPGRVLLVLLIVQTALLTWTAFSNSPVVDEIGHFPAGLSHWRFGKFDLYRVNPPLVRATATLPILLTDCKEEWSLYQSRPLVREEMPVGRTFVAKNGDRIFHYVSLARIGAIPFSLLGTIVCFSWARRLAGRRAALFAAALYVVSPNLLAHGALITPDAGASAMGLLAAYAFWAWLRHSTWRHAIVAGVSLGLAELTKTTWLVLFGLWPAIFVLVSALQPKDGPLKSWRKSQLAVILLIGLYVLNAGYLFNGSMTPLGRYQFKSVALSGHSENSMERHEFTPGNRFADMFLGDIPLPFPRDFVEGIDLQKYDFELGQPSYLRGEWRDRGWWYYYLYALAVKVPVGVLLLAVIGGFCVIRHRRTVFRNPAFLVLAGPPLVILVLVSGQTGFNKHLRYVLPILPFLFVALGVAFGAICRERSRIVSGICVLLLGWAAASSLRSCPDSLTYFNEFAGGPANGDRHLLGSNLDWGQALIDFKRWNDARSDGLPLYFSYSGLFDPVDVGIPCRPIPVDGSQLEPGWYALSTNRLLGPECPSEYFLEASPDGKIGHCIFLYRVQ